MAGKTGQHSPGHWAAGAPAEGAPKAEVSLWQVLYEGQAGRSSRRRAEAQRQEVSACKEAVQGQRAAQQDLLVAEVQELLPGLTEVTGLTSDPHHLLTVLNLRPSLVSEATNTAGWALKHNRTSNVHAALTGSWLGRNASVTPGGRVPLPPLRKKSRCLEMGHCVCQRSPEGPSRMQLRNAFIRLLKQHVHCNIAGNASALLRDGNICFKLTWSKVAVAEGTWAFAAQQLIGMESKITDLAPQGSRWFHIGLQYYKPFRSTFMELVEVEDLEYSRKKLLQHDMFLTELGLVKQLDLAASWTLQFYRLVNTDQILGKLNPSEVVVEPLPDSSELRVWPLPPRKRRARRQGPADRARRVRRAGTSEGSTAGEGSNMNDAAVATRQTTEAEAEDSTADEEEEAGDVDSAWMSGEEERELEELLDTLQIEHNSEKREQSEDQSVSEELQRTGVETGGSEDSHIASAGSQHGQSVPSDAGPEGEEPGMATAEGGSGSDAGAMPPPPLPRHALQRVFAPRQRAQIRVRVNGGLLTYYAGTLSSSRPRVPTGLTARGA